jgi:hypothetical protein
MMFTHEFNLKCYANIEHITKKKAQTRDWFLQEGALSKEVGDYVKGPLFEAKEYPFSTTKRYILSQLARSIMKHNAWEKIDRELSSMRPFCWTKEAQILKKLQI